MTNQVATAESPPLVPPELQALVDDAKRFEAKGLELEPIISAETLPRIAEFLPRLRAMVKRLDDDAKAAKAKVLASVKPQLDAIDAAVKGVKPTLEKMDKAIAGKMLELYRTFDNDSPVRITKRMEGVKGSTVTVVEKETVVLDDIKKVPKQYILPPPPPEERIDWKAVNAAAEARKLPPGFRMALEPSHLTTKAKEVVAVAQESTP